MPDSALLLLGLAGIIIVVLFAHVSITATLRVDLPARVRMVFALLGLLIGQYFAALLLLAFGMFGSVAAYLVVALCAIAGAILLRSAWVRARVRRDLIALRDSLSHLPVWMMALLVPAALMWSQATRSILMPRLDWDYLTYHGPRAAFWLTESRLWPSYDAVGVWQNYRAFPPMGDLITAWAMALGAGDLLVAPAWVGVWASLGLAAYAAARSLGADPVGAVLAAVAVLLLPAVFHHMSSGYVDNAVALAMLCGAACLAEGERTQSPPLATVGIIGFSASAAMKHTALPFLAIAGLLWIRQLYAGRHHLQWRLVSALAVVALVTSSLWFVLLALREGNPLYPFPVDVFGKHLPGATEAGIVSRSRLSFFWAAESLFRDGFLLRNTLHNGFSVGGLLILVAGTCSLLARKRQPGMTAPILLLAGLGLLAWVMNRRIGAPGLDDARYIVAAPAIAAVVLGSSRLRLAPSILGAAIAIESYYALPWRWASVDTAPMAACGGIACLVGLAIALTRCSNWRVLALGLGILGSFCCAAEARAGVRSSYFRAAAEGKIMASGPINICPSSRAYAIWEQLADAPPMTIEVSAGVHPLMTHWYIYPLLGSRLQHRLVHVRTGRHFPEQRKNFSERDLDSLASSWIARVESERANAVLLYYPPPIEAELVLRSRDHFQPESLKTPGATLFFLRRP